MNKRTVKRVKDPKGCAKCAHLIVERNGARPTTYACRVRPIVACKTTCDKGMPEGMPEEKPVALEQKPEINWQESVGPQLIAAFNMLGDVCSLNSELSADAALELVKGAKSRIESIAAVMNVNLEG